MPKIGDINLQNSVPMIYADGGTWLTCSGQLVSRKDFPGLYSKIGMSYADEDQRCCNAELFPLPDFTKPDKEWPRYGESAKE